MASVASDASVEMAAAAVAIYPILGNSVLLGLDLEESHLSHTVVEPLAHSQTSDACHNPSEENKFGSCEQLSHIWSYIAVGKFQFSPVL